MDIILNIPHSSDKGVFLFGWGKEVIKYVNVWTDWFTDVIFDRVGIISHICGWSRFVCDVERLENDIMESMGQGILYEYMGRATRKPLSNSTRKFLLDARKDYLAKISKSLTEAENPILVDCHSFPKELSDVDVCIGYNDDWSKPNENIIDSVCDIFRKHGFKVGVNTPYGNSLTPQCSKQYLSFMIELNKRIYMRDDLAMDKEKTQKVVSVIDEVYDYLKKL